MISRVHMRSSPRCMGTMRQALRATRASLCGARVSFASWMSLMGCFEWALMVFLVAWPVGTYDLEFDVRRVEFIVSGFSRTTDNNSFG